MEFNNIIERKIKINEIPAIVLTPKERQENYPTIILYHGWSSNKEAQRFRGFILCSLNFQVIIPDAIYHGERNPLESYNEESSAKYFWEIVINNIKESEEIINYATNNLNAVPKKIGVTGHSMGGFTAAGVFTNNLNIKASAVLNGSFNWKYSNAIFKKALKDFEFNESMIEEKTNEFDPMNNLNKLVDRPILMLHGSSDPVVDINPQREFYEKILPLYKEEYMVKFVEYLYQGHFVTTRMMEEVCEFFVKYLR